VKRGHKHRSKTTRKATADRLHARRVEEIPDDPEPGFLYIVGEGLHIWFVGMVCPCGCGDVLKLSLMEESRSCWTLVIHRDRTVTLWPSIAREVGCRSHFNIRRSKVIYWMDET
jgi:hypothetical protein